MLHAVNALSMACMVEPILWFLVLFSYTRFSAKTRLFSFRLYLLTQLVVSALSVPALFLVLSGGGRGAEWFAALYTQVYLWGALLAGIFALVALRYILTRLLASLVGLRRVALMSFQWLLVVAFFIILNRVLADSAHATMDSQLALISYGISLTELIVVVLLAPITFVVRRSLRSHYQDVMMGLVILAVSSSVLGIFFHASGPLDSSFAVVTGHVVLVATLVFWIGCFGASEREEQPRTLSVDSRLVRWSEKLRVLEPTPLPRNEVDR